MVSLFKGYDAGYKGLIPPYIVLTQSQGRFSEAGFLGPRYSRSPPGATRRSNGSWWRASSRPGISDQQQQQRRDLLHKLDTLGRTAKGNPALTAFYQSEDQAYDMILGDGAKVFDLSQEKAEVRSRYDVKLERPGVRARGSARAAWRRGGWSSAACPTSPSTTAAGIPTPRISRPCSELLPELDQGLATLLADLSEHGLLERTIIWCCGEFGRTPKIDWEPPWNGGRNHYGKVFSALVAGGGFKGGRVVGASDAKGEEVKDRPVYPCDLLGSIYELLGIDPDGKLPNPMGLPMTVTPDRGGRHSHGRATERNHVNESA